MQHVIWERVLLRNVNFPVIYFFTHQVHMYVSIHSLHLHYFENMLKELSQTIIYRLLCISEKDILKIFSVNVFSNYWTIFEFLPRMLR